MFPIRFMRNVPYLVGVCGTPITNCPTIRWGRERAYRQNLTNRISPTNIIGFERRMTLHMFCSSDTPQPRDAPKPNLWAGSGPARLSWAFWFGMLSVPRQQPARLPLDALYGPGHFSFQIGMTDPLWLALANTSATVHLVGRGQVRGQVLKKATRSVTGIFRDYTRDFLVFYIILEMKI